MAGEANLDILLASMNPQLSDGEYFLCTLPDSAAAELQAQPIGWFHESEGLTVVLPAEGIQSLDAACEGPFRMITLTVHSSLDAVGLLAAITTQLAEAGIPVNVFSAYFHDHLLVRTQRAVEALAVLRRLQTGASGRS
ncbi:MAG TPA: ACT domain-containing protein [Anaerolineales bacterium]|nr:ACT domain-containing protein [Anaerolineales bacterium]